MSYAPSYVCDAARQRQYLYFCEYFCTRKASKLSTIIANTDNIEDPMSSKDIKPRPGIYTFCTRKQVHLYQYSKYYHNHEHSQHRRPNVIERKKAPPQVLPQVHALVARMTLHDKYEKWSNLLRFATKAEVNLLLNLLLKQRVKWVGKSEKSKGFRI